MTVLAHVAGLPLEELLPALAGGSAGLLVCTGVMLRRYLPVALAVLVFLVGAVAVYLLGAELLL